MPTLTVAQQRDNEFAAEMTRSFRTEVISSGRLLPVHQDALQPGSTLRVAGLGASGNLFSGFLATGYREVTEALGFQPAKWVMVGNRPIDPKIAARLQQRGFEFDAKFLPMPRVAFDQRAAEMGLNAIVAATPPKSHVRDAQQGNALKVPTHIEKPGLLVNAYSTDAPAMNKEIATGRVQLLDFFFYADPMIALVSNTGKYLDGLGPIHYIHATCTEPHSVIAEGDRLKMLMNPQENGGYIGEDQLPHPLVLIHAFLRFHFKTVGLQDARFTEFFRAMNRDVWLKCKDLNLPIDDHAHTCMSMKGTVDVPGSGPIELLAFSGKGPQIRGTVEALPHSTYILEIGCLKGRVEMCIGDLTGRIDPYIAVIPRDPARDVQVWRFQNGGGGYKLFLADVLAEAAGSTASEIKDRMRVQTEASLAGLAHLALAQKTLTGNKDAAAVAFFDVSSPLVIPDGLRPGPRHGPWITPKTRGWSALTGG